MTAVSSDHNPGSNYRMFAVRIRQNQLVAYKNVISRRKVCMVWKIAGTTLWPLTPSFFFFFYTKFVINQMKSLPHRQPATWSGAPEQTLTCPLCNPALFKLMCLAKGCI